MSQVGEQTGSDQVIASAAGGAPAVAGETSEEKIARKVQLDVEDAEFLQEIPEEPKAPPPAEKKESEEEPAEDDGKAKRKKLIIIGAGVLGVILLVILLLVLGVFDSGEGSSTDEPFVFVVHDYGEPTSQLVFTQPLEPFWIEMTGENGETFFLVCNFALSRNNKPQTDEVKDHLPVIRDVIYYYLNTKDYKFLTDAKNFPEMKAELLKLVNEKVISEKLDDILYVNYTVR